MKLINRNTDFAVKALIHIANHEQDRVPVSELAEELEIPRPFLRKILQILNKNRVLNSYKGKGGGFQLSLPPDKIFLADLIKIFQGSVKWNDCLFKKMICPDIKTCVLKRKIDALERYVVSELKSITIAELQEEDLSGRC